MNVAPPYREQLQTTLVGAGVPLEDVHAAALEVERIIAAEARRRANENLRQLLIVARGHRDACLPRLLAWLVAKRVPGCESVIEASEAFEVPQSTIYKSKIALELAFSANAKWSQKVRDSLANPQTPIAR